MGAARANVRLQAWVLGIGAAVMGVKFLAWRLTGSTALLSDALESIVNLVAGSFALYSLVLAAKPRDREHPYGHGKVEFISAAIEGGLVILAALMIIARAVQGLIERAPLHRIDTGIVLAVVAGGINLVMGLMLRRRGRRDHSITLEAGGAHLLSDAWTTVALVAGLVLIRLTGLTWLDQVIAMAFALHILFTGLRVFRRSVAGIMDEADLELGGRVIAVLEENRRPAWVDVHNFRMIAYGSVLHVDCHVTLPWYYTLEEAHNEISAIENLVNERLGRTVELFIHMDPCIPSSCRICLLADCPHRKAPFEKRIPWNLDTVLGNQKHGTGGEG